MVTATCPAAYINAETTAATAATRRRRTGAALSYIAPTPWRLNSANVFALNSACKTGNRGWKCGCNTTAEEGHEKAEDTRINSEKERSRHIDSLDPDLEITAQLNSVDLVYPLQCLSALQHHKAKVGHCTFFPALSAVPSACTTRDATARSFRIVYLILSPAKTRRHE